MQKVTKETAAIQTQHESAGVAGLKWLNPVVLVYLSKIDHQRNHISKRVTEYVSGGLQKPAEYLESDGSHTAVRCRNFPEFLL